MAQGRLDVRLACDKTRTWLACTTTCKCTNCFLPIFADVSIFAPPPPSRLKLTYSKDPLRSLWGCTKGGEETEPLKRRGTNRMRSQPAAGSSLTASRAASACSCGLMKSSSSPCLGLHQIVAKPRLCAFSTRARRFTCGSDRTCFLGHAPPAANTVSVPPWFGADTAASPCTKPFPNDQVAFTHHHMVVC